MRWILVATFGVACTASDGPLEIVGDASVDLGGTVQLTAVLQPEDGAEEDVTADATWESSDPAVASVDAGLVSGDALGAATITATLGDVSAELAFEVLDPGPYDVSVTGDWSPQHGGQNLFFFARIVDDADGSVVACGSVQREDAVWTLAAADVILAGHEYHAEAFADVNGDGVPNDPGHIYFSETKRPAKKDQDFEVAHSGGAPDWADEACGASDPALTAP
jgi:Bacterial Ig-like domain (group 2)